MTIGPAQTADDPLMNDWEQAFLLLDGGGHHHLAGCVQEVAGEVERLRHLVGLYEAWLVSIGEHDRFKMHLEELGL